MHRLLYFLAFCPIFFLSAVQPAYKEPQTVASTEGLPSSIVNESVCVISGEYVDAAVDLVVPGPEPLVIQRRYGSHSLSVNGNLGRSWSLNHGELLILGQSVYDDGQEESQQVWVMALRQPSGAQLDYMYPVSKSAKKKKRLDFRLITPKNLFKICDQDALLL